MKLKLDEDGHAVVVDGRPVFVYDDGKELPFDGPQAVATITRLNGEAKGHREAKEAAEAALKSFEGIEDPAAALKALQTVADLGGGDLKTAAQVEEIRTAANKAAEERIAAVQRETARQLEEQKAENTKLTDQLYDEKIGGAFSRSQYIADKVAVPADMIQAAFGKSFKVENGEIVARDKAGNQIFSRAKPGEVAAFEEALELLIEHYPFRDSILKGSGASGGGGDGSNGNGGARPLTRAAFEKLPPAAQMEHALKGGEVTD